MSPRAQRRDVVVDGRHLSVSNLDKVLYPSTGFTKAGVIDYYRRIAPLLLPHLAGRHLTLLRFPNGVAGEAFFEKNCPSHRPPWVTTATVAGRSGGTPVEHCVVDDLPTLVWLANLAALELHAPMARAADPDHPTTIVFDLDPGAPAGLVECASVGLTLREVLAGLGLDSFPKTSGKKGLHVYVPLNVPDGPDHDGARAFAHAVARIVARRAEVGVVTEMAKAVRGGKVFIDWSQNARHKTTVAVYSLRAAERPSASTPVTWDEVGDTAEAGDAAGLRLEIDDTLDRADRVGDLFAPVLELEQRLPDRP